VEAANNQHSFLLVQFQLFAGGSEWGIEPEDYRFLIENQKKMMVISV
jgi:hypothetical protein